MAGPSDAEGRVFENVCIAAQRKKRKCHPTPSTASLQLQTTEGRNPAVPQGERQAPADLVSTSVPSPLGEGSVRNKGLIPLLFDIMFLSAATVHPEGGLLEPTTVLFYLFEEPGSRFP